MWKHDTLGVSRTFIDLIDFVFAGNKDPELFSLVIWNLWNRRNNLLLGKPFITLDKILKHSQERLIKALSSLATSSFHWSQQQTSWSPLEFPWYKINFDGATFAEDNKASLGVVIQNNEGLVNASLTQKLPLPSTVIEVEVLAVRRVLELALEIVFDNIILEGDLEILFKALKNGGRRLA